MMKDRFDVGTYKVGTLILFCNTLHERLRIEPLQGEEIRLERQLAVLLKVDLQEPHEKVKFICKCKGEVTVV